MVQLFPGLSSSAYTAKVSRSQRHQPQFGAKELGSRTQAFQKEHGEWNAPNPSPAKGFPNHSGISRGTKLKKHASNALSHLKVWEPHNGDATTQKILAILDLYDIDPGLVDFSKMYEGASGTSKVISGTVGVGATWGIGYLAKRLTWSKYKQKQKKQQLLNTGTYNSSLARPQLTKFSIAKGRTLDSAQKHINILAKRPPEITAASTEEYDGHEYQIPLWDGKDCLLILHASSLDTARTLCQHYDDHISLVSAGISQRPRRNSSETALDQNA